MAAKEFFKTFAAVLAATLFFYGFSTIGASAFTAIVAPVKKFGNYTYIGPFDVRHLDEKQAEEKLENDFAELHSKLNVEMSYQDTAFEIPNEIIAYDPKQTVDRAEPGEENTITAHVSREGLQTVISQNLPELSLTNEDMNSIAAGLEEKLASGIIPVRLELASFISASQNMEETVASYTISDIPISSHLQKVANEWGNSKLFKNGVFSVLDNHAADPAVILTNSELTWLASAIYGAALQTNLDIIERNISRSLHSKVEPGFEAAINEQLGLDFVLKNPNSGSFTLQIETGDDSLTVKFVSLPLLHTYNPYIVHQDSFPSRTVQRYSASVPAGSKQIADEGKEGAEVVVHRRILSNGQVIEDQYVSTDFYAPLPVVEVLPIERGPEPGMDDENQTNTDGNNVDTGQGSNIPDGNSEGDQNVPSDNTTTTTKPGEKPVVPPAENKGQIYDKGGNPIR